MSNEETVDAEFSETEKQTVQIAYAVSNGPGTLLAFGRSVFCPDQVEEVGNNPSEYPDYAIIISPSNEFEGMGE